jgi:hypothetical protein
MTAGAALATLLDAYLLYWVFDTRVFPRDGHLAGGGGGGTGVRELPHTRRRPASAIVEIRPASHARLPNEPSRRSCRQECVP